MFLLKPRIKENPVRRWNLPDRAFFACGACHILAHAFLEQFASASFGSIWIRPRGGFTGNHVFVTNGDLAFDYHGYVSYPRLVDHYTKRARREPGQFLHDALPRARRYLERFDHRTTFPTSVADVGQRVGGDRVEQPIPADRDANVHP